MRTGSRTRAWIGLSAAGLVGATLLSGAVLAQTNSTTCDRSRTPERMEGRVVKIDAEGGKVTVRAADGTTHEFHAAKETLKDLKLGDQLEARLRSAPGC
jgi:hypothetical protein